MLPPLQNDNFSKCASEAQIKNFLFRRKTVFRAQDI